MLADVLPRSSGSPRRYTARPSRHSRVRKKSMLSTPIPNPTQAGAQPRWGMSSHFVMVIV